MPNPLADKQLIEHFRQRIAELELELLEVPEARSRINQLGEVIVTLKEQNAMLTVQVQEALTRMDRARYLLTDGNPRPNCNWGMLDTSDIKAALPQQVKSEDARDAEYVMMPKVPTEAMIEAICDAQTGNLSKWPDDFDSAAQQIRRWYATNAYIAAISAQEPNGDS